jgi:2-iminobutanoate/2-iminopropanoate deaminase
MKKEIVNVEKAPKAVGPYSQGIAVSDTEKLFYFSGTLGINPADGKIEGDVEEQTRQIFANIETLLTGSSLTRENVVKTLVFLTNMGDFARVNKIYAEYFTGNCPARSCVEVSKLPLGGLIEIEIIAAK